MGESAAFVEFAMQLQVTERPCLAIRGDYAGYAPLVIEIAKFFKTGVPPIQPEETLEIFRFMHAADESKRKDGQVIELDLP